MEIKQEVIEMVNYTCNNTRDLKTGELIKVPASRNKDFIDAIENLGKEVPLEAIRKKLEDIIMLSQITPRENQEFASKAEVKDVVKVISAGMNDNRQITFTTPENPGEVKKGFLKSNLIPSFNDATLAMDKMGQILGVPMAKTYSAEFEGKKFIISEDVAQGDKKLLTMKEFNDRYESEWKHEQNTHEKVKNLIQHQIESVKNYGASENECKKFKDEYIKMICFDYITNQTDRNDSNYGVLIDSNGGISLAPMFDSDYILNDPSATQNTKPFSLDKKYNKEDGLKALVDLYPNETKEFMEKLQEKEKDIMEIAENYLSEDMLDGRGNYRSLLTENIAKFKETVLNKTLNKNSNNISIKSTILNAVESGVTLEDVSDFEQAKARDEQAKENKGVVEYDE